MFLKTHTIKQIIHNKYILQALGSPASGELEEPLAIVNIKRQNTPPVLSVAENVPGISSKLPKATDHLSERKYQELLA